MVINGVVSFEKRFLFKHIMEGTWLILCLGRLYRPSAAIERKMSELVCLVNKTACCFIPKRPELWNQSLVID